MEDEDEEYDSTKEDSKGKHLINMVRPLPFSIISLSNPRASHPQPTVSHQSHCQARPGRGRPQPRRRGRYQYVHIFLAPFPCLEMRHQLTFILPPPPLGAATQGLLEKLLLGAAEEARAKAQSSSSSSNSRSTTKPKAAEGVVTITPEDM